MKAGARVLITEGPTSLIGKTGVLVDTRGAGGIRVEIDGETVPCPGPSTVYGKPCGCQIPLQVWVRGVEPIEVQQSLKGVA